MSLTIKKTGAADYGQFIKVLISGEPGSGKTLISSTFPHPFYASAEGGLMSIADRDIPFVDVKDTDTLLEVKHLLDMEQSERDKKLGFHVETVVVDTIDEIQNILMRERLDSKRQEAMQLQDWGWLGEQMKAIVRGFRNLPMNVVFTCHIKEQNDSESGSAWTKPMLSGQMGDAIPGYVDLSLVLETGIETIISADKGTEVVEVRNLITHPSRKYPFIKDRSGKLPKSIPVNFEDDFERIHELIYGNIDIKEGETFVVEVPGAKPEPPKPAAAPAKKAAKKVAKKASSKAAPEPELKIVDGDGDGYLGVVEEAVEGGSPLKRFVYRVDGNEVKTRNQLPEGVLPHPDVYKGTADGSGESIYCTDCGAHLDQEQAELSRIKFRKIYCTEDFEKNNR